MLCRRPLRLAPLALLLIGAVACVSSDTAALKADAIRRGDELTIRKQHGQAAAAYRQAVDADGQDGQARYKLAQAYAQSGRAAEAATQAVQAADLLPRDVDVQLFAGAMMVGLSRFVDAADRMTAFLRDHPDNVPALIRLGNARARLVNSTVALSKLADAILDGTYDGARRESRPVTTSAEDASAEAALRKALSLAPSMREAQLAVANFLWAAGRPDEAETLLKEVADHNPGHERANRALGEFYLSRRRGAEAEPYLRHAATTGTAGGNARFVLADYLISERRDDDARTVLRRMFPADDSAGAVSLRWARLDFRTGQRDQAQRRLDALLARDPINRPGRLLQAQFAVAMRDWDRALPLARTAVAQDTNSSEAQLALGQALFAAGDLENASEALAEAVRLDPDGAESLQQLAQIKLALGKPQDALQYAQEAVRKNPDDRHAAVALVKTLVSVGDYSSAEEEIRPLLARHPTAPDVLTQLGVVQLAQGNDEAARTSFVRTLDYDRDSEDALSGLVSLELRGRRTGDLRRRVEAAVAVHPQDTAYLLLAARLYAADDDARTEPTLRKALDIDLANEGATLSLAVFLHEYRRADEAKRLLEFVPRQPEAAGSAVGGSEMIDASARVYFDAGDNPASVEIEHPVLRQMPSGIAVKPTAATPAAQVEYSSTLQFNAYGCRSDDYPVPRPANHRRILALGGGETLGVGVPGWRTFAARLERSLNPAREDVARERYDVINCGVKGYATRQERQFYELIGSRYEPSVVLLTMTESDNMSARDRERLGYVHQVNKYEHLLLTSHLFRLGRHEWRSPAADYSSSLDEVVKLAEACRARGARLAVVAFRTSPFTPAWSTLVKAVTTKLDGADIPFLDLGPALLKDHTPADLKVHRLDLSPNEDAHAIAATEIDAFLKRNKLAE